eukprot:6687558-Pyramimonas_sp.AAC.1
MGQRSLRPTPRGHQGSPKTDPSAPRAFHGAFQDAKNLLRSDGSSRCLALSHFRFRWALGASRWPHGGPNEAQEAPKKADDGPEIAQEAPRSAPRGPHDAV